MNLKPLLNSRRELEKKSGRKVVTKKQTGADTGGEETLE
jgi:hypothetical protein